MKTSYDPKSGIFSGETFPQVFHSDILVGHLLLHHFRLSPERIVQINADDGVEVTSKEMATSMKKFAAFLEKQALTFGDAVGFCANSTTSLTPAVFACLLLGLPVTPVHTSFDVGEIVSTFQRTKPKVFCDYDQVEKIEKALEVLKVDMKTVVLTHEVGDFINLKDVIETSGDHFRIPLGFNITSDKVCAAILSSSGSTGAPKLTRISHAQLSQSNYAFQALKHDSIALCFSSLFWVSGICNMVHSVLNQQTKLITKEIFTPRKCVELIAKYKVTLLNLTPPDVSSLVEYMNTSERDKSRLESIKILSTGSSFISLKKIESMESFMSNGRVEVNYGLTEACGVVSRSDLNERASSSSVGKLCINTQAKILTNAGTLGGVGDVGEILLKIPFNIIDYLNNELQSRALIDDLSWIHTGDVGYFDEDLNLFIVGRKKFMIRCRNREVSPTEIEEIVSNIAGVLHVCVVAMPESTDYEVPCAVIQRSLSHNLTEAKVHEAVKHLEDFKQLKGGVFFVKHLPLTATGKLNRYAATNLALSMARKG